MAESWRDKPQHTEFGGGNRSPGRMPDESSRPLSNSERARIERMKAMRDVPDFSTPRTQEYVEVTPSGPVVVSRPFQPDVDAIAELDEKTNRYARETKSEKG